MRALEGPHGSSDGGSREGRCRWAAQPTILLKTPHSCLLAIASQEKPLSLVRLNSCTLLVLFGAFVLRGGAAPVF